MSNLVFFVDDSARDREEVALNLREYADMDTVTVELPGEAIAMLTVDFIARLHAVILDYQLDALDHAINSRPIYAKLLELAPEFAKLRVALRSSNSEEFLRRRFAEVGVPFPPKYLGKGKLMGMIDWLTGLPAEE